MDCVTEQESCASILDLQLGSFGRKRNLNSPDESVTSTKKLRETTEYSQLNTRKNGSNVAEDQSRLKEEMIQQDDDEVTKLSDSIFIYTNRRMCTHGHVFEGEIRSGVYGARSCAIKFAQKSEQNTKEAKILAKLGSHTHVISIIQSGVHKDMFEEHVYIALEKCHKQNLSQYLEHCKEAGLIYDVNVGLEYSKQIIAGMTYVHENLIFHKDLKPSNILLSLDKSTIKLADFGLSQEIKSTSSKVFCKHPFGTNGFRPIESFGNSWASLKSDIFSLGVVFYFLLSNGKSPFGDDFHLWIYRMKYGVPDVSQLLVTNAKSTEHLIKLMLSQERCRRPSIWQVAAHPCWTGDEIECNFDCGCEEETDDSDVQMTKQQLEDDLDESATEVEKTREFLKAIIKMGCGRYINEDKFVIIFDRKSSHLQRFNPRNQSITKMHKFDNKSDWSFFAPVLLGDYIYVLTDNRSLYRLKFRDEAATWERRADLIHGHGLPVAVDSNTIIIAGASFFACNKLVSNYDASLNRWEKMEDKQLPTRFSTVVASQGFVYCIGGLIPGIQTTDRVERLNVFSQGWIEVAPMKEPRWGAAATDCGGKIFVAGGESWGRLLTSVEKYDPDINQWTILQPMTKDRLGIRFHCHLIDGKIFAVGEGHQGIEKYDVKKDSWELVQVPGDKLAIYGSVLVKMPN